MLAGREGSEEHDELGVVNTITTLSMDPMRNSIHMILDVAMIAINLGL